MKCRLSVLLACAACCLATGLSAQTAPTLNVDERLQEEFFSQFHIAAAAADADKALAQHPGDALALFVRMETAALEQRTDAVLDSALRLCTMPAPADVQEIASSRILEKAGNSQVFSAVLRRVGLAMEQQNACTFNLRLAMVAAAADGSTRLDLDKTADSAGLLTRWRIAGPFGRFSNLDLDREWPPESSRFWIGSSSVERFWFRDGMVVLPEYLSAPGVFYGASQIRIGSSHISQLDVLSPGPFTILIDGRMVLANDSRFSMLGNRRSCRIHLNPGLHRLVVKFTSDAAPFSIDVHPVFSRTSAAATPIALSAAAQGYIRGLLAWFRGDLNEVAHVAATARDDHKRALLYLEALLWSAAEDHSPRAHAAWQALAAAHPSAVLARIKVAEASDDSKLDWLRTEVADLQHLRPESEAVAQLAVSISRSNPDSASEAWGQLIRIHPTCSALLQAIKVYDLAGAQGEAERTEQRLARCAPESLDYSRVLSDSGRHNEAIAFLQRRLSRNPLNRNARRMLVQELVLAGEWQKAKSEALQLHRIAHRSADYARLASDPAAVLNSRSERARGFARGNEFYSKYRRDGVAAVGQSASETSPAGVPALVILADQVLEIQNDGTASLYCHQLTRLLSLQAIGQYGEVRVPAGADLLELRTIKPDDRTIEPELNHQKRAISMPGLEPGDSIDQEFVTHYEDWRHLPPATLRFQLGAGNTPVLQTRLVTIAPTNEEVRFALFNGAPRPIRTMSDRHVVLTWEMDHLPASVPEPFAPSIPVPTVTIKGTENELDSVRDSLLGSTRVGPHVTEALLEQTFATVTDREKARRLYQLVNAKIESSGTDLADIPAEDSLAAGQGSRTSALLALTRAAGLEAALLLARRIGANCSDDLACYSEPLVRLWLPGEVVDVDPNVDGLAFGEIPPGLDHSRVLLVALDTRAAEKGPHTPEFVALNSSPARERSVGTGDLFLDSRGNLRVSVQITPGAARAQEIRSSLHSRTDREQRTFLEQLAERLFVGATDVRGQLLHLNDPEQPLNIILQCEVPQFLKMQPGRREIAQLAPLLGLGSDLTIESTRHSPLLLDSVLSETTVFHLHLPPAVSVAGLPPNIFLHSEFGEYALKFSRGDGQLNVERQFDIPVQVIETQLYPDFRRFVKNIDEAEHQRIVLEIRAVSSLRQALQPGPK